MSRAAAPQPINPQLQSPLLRLPGEIRNIIYLYSLTTDLPITDPATGGPPHTTIKSPHHSIPPLGTALLQACRLVFRETDIRPLYTRNTFRFTSVTHMHRFLVLLSPEHSRIIRDLEIDVRDVDARHPGVSREWAQYLSWSEGIWAKKLGSLKVDAPGLRTLRLNFEAWPRIGVSRRHLWDILRRLLINVDALERVVINGSSKGGTMARRDPWSPVHFVGSDDVGSDDLVEIMWPTVRSPGNEDKLIRWARHNGNISLEVILKTHIQKANRLWVETSTKTKASDPWPKDGHCSWQEYQQRHEHLALPEPRNINPTVFV